MAQSVLRDGDIALIRARWWLRPLTRYDHAALVYSRNPRLNGEQRRWYTIEAGPSGVRDWVYGHWPRAWDVYRPLCLPRVAYDAVSVAWQWRGQPYAWWHLSAVLKRMWTNRRQKKQSIARLSQARVCTELPRDAYLAVGLDLCPGIKRPAPDDIADSRRVEYVGSMESMEVQKCANGC